MTSVPPCARFLPRTAPNASCPWQAERLIGLKACTPWLSVQASQPEPGRACHGDQWSVCAPASPTPPPPCPCRSPCERARACLTARRPTLAAITASQSACPREITPVSPADHFASRLVVHEEETLEKFLRALCVAAPRPSLAVERKGTGTDTGTRLDRTVPPALSAVASYARVYYLQVLRVRCSLSASSLAMARLSLAVPHLDVGPRDRGPVGG